VANQYCQQSNIWFPLRRSSIVQNVMCDTIEILVLLLFKCVDKKKNFKHAYMGASRGQLWPHKV
jgi:hypothetical protein